MNELTQQEQWQVDSYRDNISSLGGLIDELPEKQAIEILQESIAEQLPDNVDELLVLIGKMGWTGKVSDYCDFIRDDLEAKFLYNL